ncbi:MAG: InlB B-repeat-containing protein, partial [Nitrososphaerota archaeon]|nr:InlB B-repeat-containing protein [Nitrososphaerota archaeon]
MPVAANPGGLSYSNHVLSGWAYSAFASTPDFIVSGNSVSPSIFTIGAFGVTLYAVWAQAPSYSSVVYDGNGNTSGSVPIDSNSPYVNGSQVMVLGNTGGLVKSNYTFLGWAPSNSVSVPAYSAGSLFIISDDTTLYAVWGSAGGGDCGNFDGGVINNSLEIKCKFPYLANAPQVFSWMTAAPGNLPDYSAFLRFTNITTNDPALSADVYGLLVRNDDPVNYHSAVGVNDSLYVRQHLFVGGFIRVAETVLPLEKWINNFPTPTIPSNKRLDVDLGSATWPFRDIITLSGHIGDLYVPRAL